MKCKTCVELGLTSTLEIVSVFRTAMFEHQYYDRDGDYHLHDPNTTSTLYRCSNGHSTGETSRRHCPTCKRKEAVPAVCEWTPQRSLPDWRLTSCGMVCTEQSNRNGKCQSCGKPIKFTEAQR